MLTRIKLTNFKSWRELDIELAPLTLLFGTNSSGKSNVLQALLLLKQTAENVDRKQHINLGGTDRDYVDFGSYSDLVFGHDDKLSVGIELEWCEFIHEAGRKRYSEPIHYQVNWSQFGEKIQIDNLRYDLDYTEENPSVSAVRQKDGTYTYETSAGWEVLTGRDDRGNPTPPSTEPPTSCYMLPIVAVGRLDVPEVNLFMTSIYSGHFSRLVIDGIEYLGPLRAKPKREYLWRDTTPHTIGTDGKHTIPALVASERGGSDLQVQVAEWLKKTGLVDDFRVETIHREKGYYEVMVKIGGRESNLLDVGFGVSQVLPVVTALFFVPEGSIVLLEQPELHLHPGAQAELADLLLHVAEHRKLQLIVESHSEHLLRRLQRRIAEEDQVFARPENIKAYFCQMTEAGSQIQPVEVDEYGQIRNWPENFFGDIGGELDALTDAALARRRKELTKN
jgi:predicted ATPase